MRFRFATVALAAGLLVAGIAIFAAIQSRPQARPINVGILILEGAYVTEFAGPLDVYHHVPAEKLKVFLVSDTAKEIRSYEGMAFRADYTVDNAPPVDVLVVPSGAGSLTVDPQNARVINWIKKTARTAKFVTSHCQGAFLLGTAGLLDGRTATTFPDSQKELQGRYALCRVQKGQRIVVDGNLVTSAGGLASYEGALYVVKKLFGANQASVISDALVFGPGNKSAAMNIP
jgi:transcriptional regulator GlxA family with amidase domain